jgi:hypothetical protein
MAADQAIRWPANSYIEMASSIAGAAVVYLSYAVKAFV